MADNTLQPPAQSDISPTITNIHQLEDSSRDTVLLTAADSSSSSQHRTIDRSSAAPAMWDKQGSSIGQQQQERQDSGVTYGGDSLKHRASSKMSLSTTTSDLPSEINKGTTVMEDHQDLGEGSSSSSSASAPSGAAVPTKKPLKARLWDIWMKNWFLLGLVIAIILARFYPEWGKTGGPIKPEYTVKYGFTSMIFLLSGLGLKTKDLFISAINYRAHLMVQLTSFIAIPLFVKAVTSLVGLSNINATLLAGMLVTAATPTTISSNVVMTANADGNESLALFNAAFGNLLGVFISPLIVLILLHGTPESPSGQNGLDYPKILRDLGLTILVPILVGQIYLYFFPNSVAWMKRKIHFPTLNSACLLILVWSVFCDAFYNKTFDFVTAGEIVAVAVMQALIFWIMTFFLGILARWRPRRIRQLKAMAVEQAEIAAEQQMQRDQQEHEGDLEVQAPSESMDQHQQQEHQQPLRTRLQQIAEPMSKKDTVAILFCGATKSVAMGVPMINVLYGSSNGSQLGGLLATPLLIYHVEQLFSGAFMVSWLKRWVGRGEETVESFEHRDDNGEQRSNKWLPKWLSSANTKRSQDTISS